MREIEDDNIWAIEMDTNLKYAERYQLYETIREYILDTNNKEKNRILIFNRCINTFDYDMEYQEAESLIITNQIDNVINKIIKAMYSKVEDVVALRYQFSQFEFPQSTNDVYRIFSVYLSNPDHSVEDRLKVFQVYADYFYVRVFPYDIKRVRERLIAQDESKGETKDTWYTYFRDEMSRRIEDFDYFVSQKEALVLEDIISCLEAIKEENRKNNENYGLNNYEVGVDVGIDIAILEMLKHIPPKELDKK